MSKRQIKKRILAEALALYRKHQFPVRSFTMARDHSGIYRTVTRRYHARPYECLDELLHLCAQLDGAPT